MSVIASDQQRVNREIRAREVRVIDNEGKFALLGVRGQAVMVDPVTRTVVVHTAVHAGSADGNARGPQFQFFFDTIRTLGSS